MASFLGYTIVSCTKFQIHHNITIALLHLTSGSKRIGSIVMYKVVHRPKFAVETTGNIYKLMM